MHQAPRERAARVRAQLGAAGEAAALQLEELDRLRYGGTALGRADLRRWWRGFAASMAAGKPASTRD